MMDRLHIVGLFKHKHWADRFPGLTDSPDHSIPRMRIIHNDTPSMDMSFFCRKVLSRGGQHSCQTRRRSIS